MSEIKFKKKIKLADVMLFSYLVLFVALICFGVLGGIVYLFEKLTGG